MATGCAAHLVPPQVRRSTPRDAGRLHHARRTPLRGPTWLPDTEPAPPGARSQRMSDSRDAWGVPAPSSPPTASPCSPRSARLRGHGADRGYWPGTKALVDDARDMAALLRQRYPHTKLILMGESMGAAVLMCLATAPDPPPADGYVLVAPAVWGRAEMNVFLRTGLWLVANPLPGFTDRPDRGEGRQRQPRGDPAVVQPIR